MALYKLAIKPSAGKELASLGSKADRTRVIAKIQTVANNPRPQGSEKLAGISDRYRIRRGSYRIVYFIDDEEDVVTIYKVGGRKDV